MHQTKNTKKLEESTIDNMTTNTLITNTDKSNYKTSTKIPSDLWLTLKDNYSEF